MPLPVKPKFNGRLSTACNIMRMLNEPGVQVVAQVPTAGPVPPPTMVVSPAAIASCACCGQMK